MAQIIHKMRHGNAQEYTTQQKESIIKVEKKFL